MSKPRPAHGEHPAPGVRMSGVSATDEASLRRLYDAAVDAQAAGLTPEQQMAYRHACGLAWNRLDLEALALDAAAGRLSPEALIARMAPFVREALRYVSSGAAASSAVN